MVSQWQWRLLALYRSLWVRASLFSVLAVATALAAAVLDPLIPIENAELVGSDAVGQILNILASSMLAVTTFSLTVMVTAYGAATSTVTPRATRLIREDTTTHNVLSVFIGSFLYSLVGIIALTTGAYGEGGRLILFVVTILVIVIIVIAILRWIEHLSRLGRVAETTDRVEEVTELALRDRLENPYLGGRRLDSLEHIPADRATALLPDRTGYVQHLDAARLSAAAEDISAEIYVAALPGAFLHLARPLAYVVGEATDEAMAEIRDCFVIEDERSFDQDPRFGLSVLAEIASRALSPALNDPGTAIDVIGRAVRLLSLWRKEDHAPQELRFPRLHVPPIDEGDLFDDVFAPIARDGAGLYEVQARLQKGLLALAEIGGARFKAASVRLSAVALERCEHAMRIEAEKQALRAVAAQVAAIAAKPIG